VAVIGVIDGHDPGELLDALGPDRLRLVVACPAPSPRTVPAELVAAAARRRGIEAVEMTSVAEAVEAARADAAPEETILVTGSLYVVGAARATLS
jgi:dihydrofolate synthase/folylpolyglutamate synthase